MYVKHQARRKKNDNVSTGVCESLDLPEADEVTLLFDPLKPSRAAAKEYMKWSFLYTFPLRMLITPDTLPAARVRGKMSSVFVFFLLPMLKSDTERNVSVR